MTFDDLYPGAGEGFQPPLLPGDDGVVKCAGFEPCWNCGTRTAYVDFGFETRLCSEDCRDVKWREYFQALRNEGENSGSTGK